MFCEVYLVFVAYFCVTALCGVVPTLGQEDGPLILTPYVENGETEKAKELSVVEPSLFAGVNSHAAYFTVNKTAKWNLFFWYFPAEGVPLESTPLIIWLQGGPGVSSLFVVKKPITWGSSYSLLFIDNPVGAGFSFTKGEEYATNEDEVGACLLNFIQQFLQVFPELRRAPLFIAGESYAGKYIPAFGHYIHNNQNESQPINLKGLAIGDGWTDPPTMFHYTAMFLQLGLLDQEQAVVMHGVEEDVRKYWREGNLDEYVQSINSVYALAHKLAPIDHYNYLRGESLLTELNGCWIQFLNREDVQKALHVKKMKYESLSVNVYDNLKHEMYDTVKPWLEELLEHYGVMCYNGQLDLMVGYALSIHAHKSMKWSGAQAYLDADRFPLVDEENGKIHSFVKASGNFMDVMVRGAGHMVPADKPRAAKQIIDMFINKFK